MTRVCPDRKPQISPGAALPTLRELARLRRVADEIKAGRRYLTLIDLVTGRRGRRVTLNAGDLAPAAIGRKRERPTHYLRYLVVRLPSGITSRDWGPFCLVPRAVCDTAYWLPSELLPERQWRRIRCKVCRRLARRDLRRRRKLASKLATKRFRRRLLEAVRRGEG